MFEVRIGNEAAELSWQGPFMLEIDSPHIHFTKSPEVCTGTSRLAFVVAESLGNQDSTEHFVRDLHSNKLATGGPFWPHDCVAVAIYFCEECAQAVTVWNQA